MPEHVNIADPEIHEPKGIASASANQELVADGAGSGSWKYGSRSHHAEMTITNNATATAVTAAADATLNTDSDYVKVTAGWAATHADGITFNTDELVCPVAGTYLIQFWCALKVPLNNHFVGIKYAINDTTPYSSQKIVAQSTTTNDYLNMFASGMVDLSATDTVSIYVAGTKTDNLIIEEAGCQATLIHPS